MKTVAATDPAALRARTRDRVATEERILASVGQVLARDGFAAVGVTHDDSHPVTHSTSGEWKPLNAVTCCASGLR